MVGWHSKSTFSTAPGGRSTRTLSPLGNLPLKIGRMSPLSKVAVTRSHITSLSFAVRPITLPLKFSMLNCSVLPEATLSDPIRSQVANAGRAAVVRTVAKRIVLTRVIVLFLRLSLNRINAPARRLFRDGELQSLASAMARPYLSATLPESLRLPPGPTFVAALRPEARHLDADARHHRAARCVDRLTVV